MLIFFYKFTNKIILHILFEVSDKNLSFYLSSHLAIIGKNISINRI